jgi:hypothetical protein
MDCSTSLIKSVTRPCYQILEKAPPSSQNARKIPDDDASDFAIFARRGIATSKIGAFLQSQS